MSQTGLFIIYGLVFACGFLIMQTLVGAGRQATARVKMANARMKRLESGENNIDIIARMRVSRSLNKDGELSSVIKAVNKMVLQSGAPLGKYGIYFITLGLFIVLPIIAWFTKESLIYVGLAFGAAFLWPYMGLRFLIKRRLKKIGSQLPEALDVIVRSLGAGHPVPVAMNMVAREMSDPIGGEFGITSDEISYGTSLGKGIGRMSERVGHPDFDLFSATIRLQERSGGNLAELLRVNAHTIRDRQRMRLKIQAASAEGRASALILNIAPIVLYGAIKLIAPDFYGSVEDNPALDYGLWGCVIWMGIGNLVMRKMIAFRI